MIEQINITADYKDKQPDKELHNQLNAASFSFSSLPENVALARVLAAAMASLRDITLAEADEIKVAVSEAVSNAIIHGYQGNKDRTVYMDLKLDDDCLVISVHDDGIGIENIEEAMKPNFSTKNERMGLGFAFMHTFMDTVEVKSVVGRGTTVVLSKKLSL